MSIERVNKIRALQERSILCQVQLVQVRLQSRRGYKGLRAENKNVDERISRQIRMYPSVSRNALKCSILV